MSTVEPEGFRQGPRTRAVWKVEDCYGERKPFLAMPPMCLWHTHTRPCFLKCQECTWIDGLVSRGSLLCSWGGGTVKEGSKAVIRPSSNRASIVQLRGFSMIAASAQDVPCTSATSCCGPGAARTERICFQRASRREI